MKKRGFEDLPERQQKELRWLLGEIAEEIADGRREFRSELGRIRTALDEADMASKKEGPEGLLRFASSTLEELRSIKRNSETKEEYAGLWLQYAMCLKIDELRHRAKVLAGRMGSTPPGLARVPSELTGRLRLMAYTQRRGRKQKWPPAELVKQIAVRLTSDRSLRFEIRHVRSNESRCPSALARAIQAKLLKLNDGKIPLTTIRRRLDETDWELPLRLRAPRR